MGRTEIQLHDFVENGEVNLAKLASSICKSTNVWVVAPKGQKVPWQNDQARRCSLCPANEFMASCVA